MVNKRWPRVISLILASVCLISVMTAAAADVVGKKTLWDLQTAINQGDTTSYADILKDILGNPNELAPKEENVYEIWSELGLRNMADNAAKGYTFKLMKDIDMGGKNWTPVSGFKGTFDGNGYTISNVTITKAVGNTMGFFANTANNDTTIKNLHLDVQIIVDGTDDKVNDNSGVCFVGAIVGENNGSVEGCSSVCTVVDKRQLADLDKTYYGALVGNHAQGAISGTNALEHTVNITERSEDFRKPDTKVNSKMALFLSDSVNYATKTAKTAVGIAGNGDGTGIDQSLIWQDTTNCTDLAHQNLQDRREAAAARMYELCTVEWKPVQTMYNYNNYSASNGWSVETKVNAAGTSGSTVYMGVQRGLPYAHSTNSLERFNDLVRHYTGEQEQWDTKAYFYNTSDSLSGNDHATYDQTEWGLYIGSDCSGQVASAWRVVSAVNKSVSGWVSVVGTADIYPSQKYMDWYNVKPVNDLVFEEPGDLDGNGTADQTADKARYVTNYYNNNKTHYLDALAMTTKADALVGYTNSGNGHAIMAISDAVAIRKWNGEVDMDLSYIVTAEQGGSGTDSDGINRYSKSTTEDGVKTVEWSSTCCVDRRSTFADIVREGDGAGKTSWKFFPVTCDVLKNADSPAGNVTITMDAAGQITSSFHIVSTTVNGETVYTGMAAKLTTYRNPKSKLVLTDVHSAVEAGASVTVQLANGQKYTGTFGTAGLTEVK